MHSKLRIAVLTALCAVCLTVAAGCGAGSSATGQAGLGYPRPALSPGLPALPGAASPVSAFRQTSDTLYTLLGDASVGSNGSTHVDPATHVLTLVPGGEDELSYAIYTLPGMDQNRPSTIDIEASSIFPGGEDELNYWVFVSNYTTNRWMVVNGPNADKSFSAITPVELNSAQMRERVVSVKGAADPTFSFAVVTRGNSFNSTAKAWDAQPRVEITSVSTSVRDVTAAGYFPTKPAFIPLTGIAEAGSGAADSVELAWTLPADTVNGGVNEAQTVEVFRQRIGDAAPVKLGEVAAPGLGFTDPDDNGPGIAAPVAGEKYVYTLHGVNTAGFNVSSAQPVFVGGWGNPAVADSTSANAGAALALVAGKPALACIDADTNRLKYVRANAADGSAWAPAVNPGGPAVLASACALVQLGNTFPAIAYYDATDLHLKFLRATEATGNTWGTPKTLDNSGIVGAFASLKLIGGNPAVSYYDISAGHLKFVRASNVDGTAWAAPTVVDSADFAGQYTSLAEVEGKPAISYYDAANKDLKYILAGDVRGTIWSGGALALDITGDVGRCTSLAVVNGKPAISYLDATNAKLKYVSANDAGGAAWGAPQELDDMGTGAAFTSLGLISGMPAVSYTAADGTLRFIRATDADGAAWQAPVTADSAAQLAGAGPLANLASGAGAIGYCDDVSGELRFIARY